MVKSKKSLAAMVGASAAACLLWFTPAQEGTVYKTYRDIGGVLTYCTGATENAQWGKEYTPEQCQAQLDKDLQRHAQGILDCMKGVTLDNGQMVAYVDFAYNVGVTGFCRSTVARKAREGDKQGSCDALLMWDMAGGKRVAGLAKRREREREICLNGIPKHA